MHPKDFFEWLELKEITIYKLSAPVIGANHARPRNDQEQTNCFFLHIWPSLKK